jgi:acyl dehydratase
MMTEILYDDYDLNTERETGGRTITETDIVIHAGQTGDFYPHHMDTEWCKTQPFKQRMAHGTLIFSMAIGMAASVINSAAITYGYERLRFIKPVFIGDTIKVKITIKEKREYKNPDFGIIIESVQVVNQSNDIVLVCEHLLLTKKRVVKG